MFTGLCGGLGELTNVDATLYRILLVVLTILSSGIFIVLYLIVSMVVPKTPDFNNPFGYNHRPHGGNPFGGNPFGGNPFGGNPFNDQGPMNHRPNHNHGQWNHGSQYNNNQAQGHTSFQSSSTTDQMMDDLEKKAMRREIEELKAKISELEKGE